MFVIGGMIATQKGLKCCDALGRSYDACSCWDKPQNTTESAESEAASVAPWQRRETEDGDNLSERRSNTRAGFMKSHNTGRNIGEAGQKYIFEFIILQPSQTTSQSFLFNISSTNTLQN